MKTKGGETILLVDDEPAILTALKRDLRTWAAEGNHKIEIALVVSQALEILKKEEIAVLITDLNMPGTKGGELLKNISENHPDVVAIVLSGYVSTADIPDFLTYNLFGFLEKPWEKQNLLIQIERGLELFRHRRNSRRLEKLQKAEWERALRYQKIYRSKEIPEIRGVSLDLYHSQGPDYPFGGDYWDIHTIDEHRFAVLLGDVAGTGLTSALTALLLKGLIHVELIPQLGEFSHPSDVLRILNERLCRPGFLPEESFVSLTVLFCHTGERTVQVAQAGQPPFIHYANGQLFLIGQKALPLGVEPEHRWSDGEITLHTGEQVIITTDGIYPVGQLEDDFTEQDLRLIIKNHLAANGTMEDLVKTIDQAFASRDLVPREDEVTLIQLHMK